MLRFFLAVAASLVAGLLLAAVAFGGAWNGFEFGFGFAGDVAALSAASLLVAAVIATFTLPPRRFLAVAISQALPLLGLAALVRADWAWVLLAATLVAGTLGAWWGPRAFGRLPARKSTMGASRG